MISEHDEIWQEREVWRHYNKVARQRAAIKMLAYMTAVVGTVALSLIGFAL